MPCHSSRQPMTGMNKQRQQGATNAAATVPQLRCAAHTRAQSPSANTHVHTREHTPRNQPNRTLWNLPTAPSISTSHWVTRHVLGTAAYRAWLKQRHCHGQHYCPQMCGACVTGSRGAQPMRKLVAPAQSNRRSSTNHLGLPNSVDNVLWLTVTLGTPEQHDVGLRPVDRIVLPAA